MEVSLNNIYNELIDNISVETTTVLSKSLITNNIIEPSAHLGGNKIKDDIKKEIIQANPTEKQTKQSITTTRIELTDIFNAKQKKVNKVFNLSLITVSAFLVILIIGIVFVFIQDDKSKLGIITSLISILPAFISATAFVLYRKENSNMKGIENDIIKLRKLESYFEMTDYINDEEQKNKAYSKIIGQMK